MPRLPHGMIIDPKTVSGAREAVAEDIAKEPLGFAMVKRVEFERRFAFLSPELQEDPDNRQAPITSRPGAWRAEASPLLSTMSFPSEHALRESTRETRKRHER